MRRLLLLLPLLLFFVACEEEAEELTVDETFVGTWLVTNMGDYENSDCSGAAGGVNPVTTNPPGADLSSISDPDRGEIQDAFHQHDQENCTIRIVRSAVYFRNLLAIMCRRIFRVGAVQAGCGEHELVPKQLQVYYPSYCRSACRSHRL